MARDIDGPVAEAHGELSLARIALAEGDLHHAANHLAGAIGYAPQLPEIHEMLAMLAAQRPEDGALGLFDLEDRAFIGTVVARAHLLAATAPDAALRLLSQATAFAPHLPWADAAWVRALPPEAVDADTLVSVFITVMRSVGDPATDDVRQANDVYLDLAARAVRAYPREGLVAGAAAGLCRRLGDTALAVRWGERAAALEPGKMTSVWYAYALRADGQLARALDVMREAREQNPVDLDLYADAANWLADADRLDDAVALLDDALRIDPTYDCAVHTASRLRFQRDGEVRHLIALVDFMRDHPVGSHEHTDLDSACNDRVWLGVVAGPTEATINVLEQIEPDGRDGLRSLALSGLEVPSALTLLRKACPGIVVDVVAAPPPELVTPRRPGPELWHYTGTFAEPAVPPPSAQAAELLAGLATPYWAHPVAAYDHALPLGELPAAELLSLLVHPPQRPDAYAYLPYGYWERCAQVFACLGILHCRDIGGGPARRRLLADIANGIEDWTTEAALFALTVAAWLDPDCRVEVCDVVTGRFLDAVGSAQDRVVTILRSLAILVQLVPDLEPAVGSIARDVLDQLTPPEQAPDPDRSSPS